jgi:apolipoprotein D and lipocalin family protein
MKKITTIATLFGLLFNGCATKQYSPLKTVEMVELDKYKGTWYEIARYENWFEKKCARASAEYILNGDKVKVINSCFDINSTKINGAKGVAKAVSGSNNSKLRVSFFWPFYGDYWILMLADDYRYSVVGEPSREYLWILSRDKILNENDKTQILSALPALGYDASKLYWSQ